MAEKSELLDNESEAPPVVLQLPLEISHGSLTYTASDELSRDDASTEWSPSARPEDALSHWSVKSFKYGQVLNVWKSGPHREFREP